jgi:DNA-binding FrmR family transcriptional regulator
MEASVQIAIIGMIGSICSAVAAAVAAYFGSVNRATLHVVKKQMDGQLSETVALKEAVAFGKGEDQQRDKQDIKEAVAAGIKQANGGDTH